MLCILNKHMCYTIVMACKISFYLCNFKIHHFKHFGGNTWCYTEKTHVITYIFTTCNTWHRKWWTNLATAVSPLAKYFPFNKTVGATTITHVYVYFVKLLKKNLELNSPLNILSTIRMLSIPGSAIVQKLMCSARLQKKEHI